MSDTQGRGPYYDDRRIEKETKRPTEQVPKKTSVDQVRDQTQDKVRRTFSGG